MDSILSGLPYSVSDKVKKCTSTKHVWDKIQIFYEERSSDCSNYESKIEEAQSMSSIKLNHSFYTSIFTALTSGELPFVLNIRDSLLYWQRIYEFGIQVLYKSTLGFFIFGMVSISPYVRGFRVILSHISSLVYYQNLGCFYSIMNVMILYKEIY